jgi:hypothetical protein
VSEVQTLKKTTTTQHALLAVALVTIACETKDEPKESAPADPSAPVAVTAAAPGPALPNFKIISDDSMPPYKLQVTVELDKKATEAELVQVAKTIRDERRPHERAFINFNIANEAPPEGMSNWAVVRWDPGAQEPRVSVFE